MMCANDPWESAPSQCPLAVVGAYLTILEDGHGEPIAVVVPTCATHSGLISAHLEDIAIADGMFVNADSIDAAVDCMNAELGLPVHALSTTLVV